MISYASVDRIEKSFAVCEVEMIPIQDSKPEDFATKPTQTMDIYLPEIPYYIGVIKEGDILIVSHNCERVTFVYYKDKKEKEQRLKILKDFFKR